MAKANELSGGECILIDGKPVVPVDVTRNGDTVMLHFSNRAALVFRASDDVEIPSDCTMNFTTA